MKRSTRAMTFLLVVSSLAAGKRAAAQDLPGHVVDVTATEFFFEAPDSIPSGLTTFRLTQAGIAAERALAGKKGRELVADQGDNTRGFHMLWVIRLDEGKTVADLSAAAHAGAATPWKQILGGPAFAVPPRTTNATMDLQPGTYALVCYVGSAREDRNRHHLLHGMVRQLVVTPSTAALRPPVQPDVVARITAEGVEFSAQIRAGRQIIEVRNDMPREREFVFVRNGVGAGGLSSVRNGATIFTTIDFEPGDYVVSTGFANRNATPQTITVASRSEEAQ